MSKHVCAVSLGKKVVSFFKDADSRLEFLPELCLDLSKSKGAFKDAYELVPDQIDGVRQGIATHKTISSLGNDLRVWFRITDLTINVLGHVTDSEFRPPAMSLHILPDKASAWVSLIAAHDSWRQNCSINVDIVELDVLDGNHGDCGTVVQGIQKTSRVSFMMRLVLLLRSNIDCPPDWSVNLNVVVDDVGDLTSWSLTSVIGNIGGIALHIDSLEWMVESVGVKSNIADARVFLASRDRADSHSDAEPHGAITDQDVLRAGSIRAITVKRLDSDSIIVACNVQSLDHSILSSRVQAISVERVCGQGNIKQAID